MRAAALIVASAAAACASARFAYSGPREPRPPGGCAVSVLSGADAYGFAPVGRFTIEGDVVFDALLAAAMEPFCAAGGGALVPEWEDGRIRGGQVLRAALAQHVEAVVGERRLELLEGGRELVQHARQHGLDFFRRGRRSGRRRRRR